MWHLGDVAVETRILFREPLAKRSKLQPRLFKSYAMTQSPHDVKEVRPSPLHSGFIALPKRSKHIGISVPIIEPTDQPEAGWRYTNNGVCFAVIIQLHADGIRIRTVPLLP